jgi:hypothetical protein
MAIMISEVYEAFRIVGVPEDSARKAAEALSAENLATKSDINAIQKELLVLKWMLAVVVAATVLPLLKGSLL